MKFNPEMLVLARESRGIVQKELANRLNIEQGTLSKIENGLLGIDESFILQLVPVLEYPYEFYFQEEKLYNPNLYYYRKNVSIPVKTLKQAEAEINITRINLDKLLNSVELPLQNLIQWNVEDHGSPELAAKYLREYWKVPRGRIENLTKILEDNGIIVVLIDFPSDKLAGLSMFSKDNHPIIFINKNMPGDRQILTVAHELGHLVLHFNNKISEGRDVEGEAYDFAGEFLMPEKEVSSQLLKLDIATLLGLKKYWKMSVRAIIIRAKKLGFITENQYKYLLIKMNKEWGAKNEPVQIPLDPPTLVKEILDLHLSDLSYSKIELAKLLCITEDELSRRYLETQQRLKIIR